MFKDAKAAHDPKIKWPRLEVVDEKTGEIRQESGVEWQIRVLSNYLDRIERKENETDEQLEERIAVINMEDHVTAIAYDFISGLFTLLGLENISREDFDDTSYEQSRSFINDILSHCKIIDPEGLFFPLR